MLQEPVHFQDRSLMAPFASLAIDCPVGFIGQNWACAGLGQLTMRSWAHMPWMSPPCGLRGQGKSSRVNSEIWTL